MPGYFCWIRFTLAATTIAFLAGCGGGNGDDDDDDDADGGPEQGCELPEYGDGTCQPDLACSAPDIDCFTFFASQDEADTWFASFEAQLATEEMRAPRAIVSTTDARFAAMRDALDRGWAAYQAALPVGDLAQHAPALVLVEDPDINAFVIPDLATDRMGFAVMVQTGLLDVDMSDDAVQGLVMHELTHAVRLHSLTGVRESLHHYYVADDEEPLGFEQADDPIARVHGEAWLDLADDVGAFDSEEIGAIPLGGDFEAIMTAALAPFGADDACQGSLGAYSSFYIEMVGAISALDAGLHLPADPTRRERADEAMARLRDECLADFDASFVDVAAGVFGVTAEQIRAGVSAEDLALVEGVHFIDAMTAIMLDRRTGMRAAAAAFEDETGAPWSSLRFFSFEEAADDASVPVLAAMELSPSGLGDFLLSALSEPTLGACNDLLTAQETPPYGVDYTDEHHATCWRVDHSRQIAAGRAAALPLGQRPPQTPAVSIAPRRGLHLPPRLAERISY